MYNSYCTSELIYIVTTPRGDVLGILLLLLLLHDSFVCRYFVVAISVLVLQLLCGLHEMYAHYILDSHMHSGLSIEHGLHILLVWP